MSFHFIAILLFFLYTQILTTTNAHAETKDKSSIKVLGRTFELSIIQRKSPTSNSGADTDLTATDNTDFLKSCYINSSKPENSHCYLVTKTQCQNLDAIFPVHPQELMRQCFTNFRMKPTNYEMPDLPEALKERKKRGMPEKGLDNLCLKAMDIFKNLSADEVKINNSIEEKFYEMRPSLKKHKENITGVQTSWNLLSFYHQCKELARTSKPQPSTPARQTAPRPVTPAL